MSTTEHTKEAKYRRDYIDILCKVRMTSSIKMDTFHKNRFYRLSKKTKFMKMDLERGLVPEGLRPHRFHKVLQARQQVCSSFLGGK